MKKAGIVLALIVAAMAVAVPALASKHHHHKGHHHKSHVKTAAKVKVGDDYYNPTGVKFTVPKQGKKVKFKWANANTDSHNVWLNKGPKGLSKKQKKSFRSATGSIGVKFAPTFKKKGTYKFICTVHPTTMQLTVKVK